MWLGSTKSLILCTYMYIYMAVHSAGNSRLAAHEIPDWEQAGFKKFSFCLETCSRTKAVYYRAVFRAEIEKCCRFCQKNLYYRTEILTKSRNSEKTGVRNRGQKSEFLTR